MNNQYFSMFINEDFFNNMPGMNAMPFDMNALMETNRKNMQAVGEAQQRTMQGMQDLLQRQSEIISNMVENNSKIAMELVSEKPPEKKVALQADILKKVYETSMTNMRELSDLLSKSSQDASDIINKRVTASLTEIKSAAEGAAKNVSQKKAA